MQYVVYIPFAVAMVFGMGYIQQRIEDSQVVVQSKNNESSPASVSGQIQSFNDDVDKAEVVVEEKSEKKVVATPKLADEPKKKKKKGGTKKKDDDFDFDFYVPPVYVPSLTRVTAPSAPAVDYAAIEAARQKKQTDCKKDADRCMNSIGSKISHLAGSSAYQAAARAYGDACNREYKACLK